MPEGDKVNVNLHHDNFEDGLDLIASSSDWAHGERVRYQDLLWVHLRNVLGWATFKQMIFNQMKKIMVVVIRAIMTIMIMVMMVVIVMMVVVIIWA